MNWIIYSLFAIAAIGISDLFRKLGSNLKDPLFTNILFQIGSLTTAVIMYFLFSRQTENNSKGIVYALIGGALISIFSAFSFKALSTGPGVSVVIPVLRIGGVILVATLGIILFKDKFTWQIFFGLVFSIVGVYLLFSS